MAAKEKKKSDFPSPAFDDTVYSESTAATPKKKVSATRGEQTPTMNAEGITQKMFTTKIDVSLHQQLKTYAAQHNMSIQDILDEALRAYMK